MADIIPFPPTRPSAEIIRLFSGTVSSGTDAGTFKHFLEYEAAGGAMIVWDGPTYDGARAAAREWQKDGVRLIDNTLSQLR